METTARSLVKTGRKLSSNMVYAIHAAPIHPGENGGQRLIPAIQEHGAVHECGQADRIDGHSRGRRHNALQDTQEVADLDYCRPVGTGGYTPGGFDRMGHSQLFIENGRRYTAAGNIQTQDVHSLFRSCPPNLFRITASILLAKASGSRD